MIFIENETISFTQLMKHFRKKANMTQQELAEAMKVTQPHIVKLERGGYDKMNVQGLTKYSEALGHKMHILFEPH